MPLTSVSTSTPYCTASQFFTLYAYQLAGDMLRVNPDAPRPSLMAMLDQTNPAGARLFQFLLLGSGEVESACSVASRYTPLDLAALTGASAVLLQELTAARAMWGMYKRLRPGSARPEEVPGVKESMEMLKSLRDGEALFTFSESMAAGNPSVKPAQPQQLLTANVVQRASRLFVNYGTNVPGPNNNGQTG